MASFFDFVRDQRTKLPIVQAPATLTGGTYVVTGANTGLGFECAKHLVRLGAARVVLAVRSRERGDAALMAIRKATGRHDVGEVWELDLASSDSIEAFAKRLDALDRLDALIENASIIITRFNVAEGMELSLMVNVVGTMLLAVRALPKLQQSAHKFNIQGHLVVVSSTAALGSKMKGTVDGLQGDVFDALSQEKNFNARVQYPTTKLLQIYAVRQLASLFPVSETNVIINMTNPGLCYTELDRNLPCVGRLYMAGMRKMLARTAEEGSWMLLQAAFASTESHGKWCSECAIKDHVIPPWVSDNDGARTQKRVWVDLVKRLDAQGHGLDVGRLLAETTEAN
ncbi:short-chain dehydrogenase [Penicillium riverlandense]|uniref:short-chain dehydrogenase n=1 Tax=Penicillium riverlandense TaxID=1903569 RepID=UPI0025491418|nr:short-chain dehydrogenase [Penicillium riverlandense]KAJ5808823.1 short-chain dehydrogenase [Penicillium riverlandense]